MTNLKFISQPEIEKIQKSVSDPILRAKIVSDIFRINTLYMIMNAGSGHIGTSFSCMDIVTWLWTEEMTNPNEWDKETHDTYFSSKGHDAPAIYSMLIGLGKLDFELIHKLRRLGGLPGHPDVSTPYTVTNTGSLGMGISKARGLVTANRLKGKKGNVFVLTGDGELQEGNFWESLQPTANRKFSEIIAIVDNNKIQSDLFVKDTSDLGDLENKLRSFGWEVKTCDGHDFDALRKVFDHFKTVPDKPKILIAYTVKGEGVSFMTKMADDGFYKFHSGAPSPENYEKALEELTTRVNENLEKAGQEKLNFKQKEMLTKTASENPEKLVGAYGDELVKIAREKDDVIAMDADLVLDTGLIPFKNEFPDRYIECGIAEQDMVSLAGGLALKDMLPIVHSFACFLTTRPNEQIYNNATEKKKIIYTGSLAGLIPAGPGHSHQSVRDISAIGGVPGLTLIQPSNEKETRMALRWAVEQNKESTYIRLVSVPCEIPFKLPEDYKLELGKGVVVESGTDAVLISYGPVMLAEAVKTARLLKEKGISVAVVNLPWLNNIDKDWLKELSEKFKTIFTLDDHYVDIGQGTLVAATLARISQNHPKIVSFGLTEIPECGQTPEILKHHKLDSESLAEKIKSELD